MTLCLVDRMFLVVFAVLFVTRPLTPILSATGDTFFLGLTFLTLGVLERMVFLVTLAMSTPALLCLLTGVSPLVLLALLTGETPGSTRLPGGAPAFSSSEAMFNFRLTC